MFFDLDARVQGAGRVVGQNGDDGLQNDVAGVHPGIDIVDGAAGFCGTVFDGLFPRVKSRVAGKERGMDVQNATWEFFQKWSSDKAHEAGEANEIDTGVFEFFRHCCLSFVGKSCFVAETLDEGMRDSSSFGSLQDEGIGVVAENKGDFGVEFAIFDRVDKCLHVGAGTRAENAETCHDFSLVERAGGEKSYVGILNGGIE